MALFRTCYFCGAVLDVDEKCDCLSENQTDTTTHTVQDRHIRPTIRYRPRKEVRKNEQSKIELSCGSVLEP